MLRFTQRRHRHNVVQEALEGRTPFADQLRAKIPHQHLLRKGHALQQLRTLLPQAVVKSQKVRVTALDARRVGIGFRTVQSHVHVVDDVFLATGRGGGGNGGGGSRSGRATSIAIGGWSGI